MQFDPFLGQTDFTTAPDIQILSTTLIKRLSEDTSIRVNLDNDIEIKFSSESVNRLIAQFNLGVGLHHISWNRSFSVNGESISTSEFFRLVNPLITDTYLAELTAKFEAHQLFLLDNKEALENVLCLLEGRLPLRLLPESSEYATVYHMASAKGANGLLNLDSNAQICTFDRISKDLYIGLIGMGIKYTHIVKLRGRVDFTARADVYSMRLSDGTRYIPFKSFASNKELIKQVRNIVADILKPLLPVELHRNHGFYSRRDYMTVESMNTIVKTVVDTIDFRTLEINNYKVNIYNELVVSHFTVIGAYETTEKDDTTPLVTANLGELTYEQAVSLINN